MSLWNPGNDEPLRIIRSAATGDPLVDLMSGIGLLEKVRSGDIGPTLRIYRPVPTLAFGQRDVRLPGYDDAVAASRAHGFAPVVRKAGGRAAAYHPGTLIVDHVEPAEQAMIGHQERFRVLGDLYAGALRTLGVDAAVGELPGEYCPGEYSVHGNPSPASATRVPVKLIGTAQRVVTGAWLFASVFVVRDSAPLRAVLTDVYDAMGLDFEPATAGSVEDLVPGVDTGDVEAAIVVAYAAQTQLLLPQGA
jgi:lipoate-protein ligase A